MNHLRLVPADETPLPRPEPEELWLRPLWVIRDAVNQPPLSVRLRVGCPRGPRERRYARAETARVYGPVLPAWKTDPTDLENYRAQGRRGPAWAPEVRPVRPAGMRVLADEIVLPRSRRRKVAVPRRMIAGESPESLGALPLTADERAEMQLEVAEALQAGETFGPPSDDRDCPAGPCPRVSCRHNLYVEITGKFTTLNFPGLHIDEVPETCSLRVAREAAERRTEARRHQDPAMSCAEIGRFLNLTPETIRKDLKGALAKLRAAGVALK